MKSSMILLFSALFALNAHAMTGVYEVPAEPGMNEAATYPLENIEVSISGGSITLSYDMPVELTGIQNDRIDLGSSAITGFQLYSLSGGRGDATCFMATESLTCLVSYHTIGVNFSGLEAILTEKYPNNPGMRENRMSVAEDFHTDPGGIVKIRL